MKKKPYMCVTCIILELKIDLNIQKLIERVTKQKVLKTIIKLVNF